MIWLIIFLIFVLIDILLFIFLPASQIKEVVLMFVSLIIGVLGFSFKDTITNFKIRKKVQKKYKEICSRFNKYFSQSILLEEKSLKELTEEESENELLTKTLEQNIQNLDSTSLNSIKLCYFCLKWKETKAPEDYEAIKRLADALNIRHNQLTDSVKLFIKVYDALVLNKKPLNQINQDNLKYDTLLKSFVKEYYKDLQFFEIKEKFLQNKNLYETLIKIIKDGKLSTYGITQETVKRLQKQINIKSRTSNVFVIFANLAAIDKDNLKNYLKRYGSINAAGISQRTEHNMRFALYIIKTENQMTTTSILDDIKRNANIISEANIRVVPLNYADSETYTLPLNQSFTNENLKKCYETLEWFKVGFNYSDALLWSEITASSITVDELLSVIPFNIFCMGILPSEREFIIKNYDSIKTDLGVTTLTDWKDKDISLIVSTILKYGKPDYSTEELTSILKTNMMDREKDFKIEKRLLSIAKQIVNGAKKFDKSLKPKNISE